jgi:hypothetical protein
MRVGVGGAEARPVITIVPPFEKIEPTPQERAVLGEPEHAPMPDVLAFYQPPRGVEHGVSTETFILSTGIGGMGGVSAGRAIVYPRYSTHGWAGRHAFAGAISRLGESVGRLREATAEAGRPWPVDVGEGLPRRGASHAQRRAR